MFITLVFFGVFLTGQLFAKDKPNIFSLVDDMGVGDTSVPFFYEDGKPKEFRPMIYTVLPYGGTCKEWETLYSGIFVFGLFTHPYQFNDRTSGSASWSHHMDASQGVQN